MVELWAAEVKASAPVHIQIVQPRVKFSNGTSVDSASYTVRDVIEWRQEVLRVAIDATRSPAVAQYVQGDYCRFCPARHICPLKRKQAAEEARKAFAGDLAVVAIEDVPDVELILPDPDDVDQMAYALKVGTMLKLWAERVEQIATGRAKKGTRYPGQKLVRKQTKRKWKSEDDVIAALKKNATFTDGTTTKPKTPAQMLKAGALDEETIGALATKPPGALVLAPESDDRKEVTLAVDAFAKVEG